MRSDESVMLSQEQARKLRTPTRPVSADERCPVCGTPGRIVSGDEGTAHFEAHPLDAGEGLDVERLTAVLYDAITNARDWLDNGDPYAAEYALRVALAAHQFEPPAKCRACERGDEDGHERHVRKGTDYAD